MGLLGDIGRKNLHDSWAAEADANAKAAKSEARYNNVLALQAAAEAAATVARTAREAEEAFNAKLDSLNFSGSKESVSDNFVALWGMYADAVAKYKETTKAFGAQGNKQECIAHLNAIKEKMEFAFIKLRSADSEQAQFYQKKYDDTEVAVKEFVKNEKKKWIIYFSSLLGGLIIMMIVCIALAGR